MSLPSVRRMPSSEQLNNIRGTVLTENTDDFIIGDRVWVNGTKPGYIQYLGETRFSPGEWAGVVLDDHSGKNDGSVAGVRYFQCEPKRGVFARLHKLTRYPLLNAKDTSPSTPPTCVTPTQRCSTPTRTPSPGLGGRPREGDRVVVASASGSNKTGTLRYVGTTDFAAGEWAGVELDEPLGKNDGTVAGKRYFRCSPNYGLFSPLHKVSKCSGSTHRYRKIETNNITREGESSKESPTLLAMQQMTDQQGTGERNRLKQLLDASENERRRLVAQLEEEKRKVEELEFRVDEACITKDDLEMERSVEKKKIADLERQLKEEKKKNDMLTKGATPDSIMKEELKRTKEEISILRQKLHEAESQKSDTQFRSLSPSGRTIREDSELRRKEEALMQAQLSLDNKRREVQNLLTRVSEMEKELAKHQTRHEKQMDIIDDLNVKLQKSESKCVDLTEELMTVKENLEEVERKLRVTSERLEQLESEKNRLEEQLSAPPEEASIIPALNARILDRDKQLETLRLKAETERNESREKWKKELEERIKTLSQEHHEEMQREKKRAQKAEEESAKRIQTLEKNMENQRAELESMRSESETVRMKLQEADVRLEDIGKMADQVGRLQAERDLLQVEKEETWKRLQVSEEARKKSERDAQHASDEVHSLKSQVNRLKSEFTSYREDLLKKLAQTEFDTQLVQDLQSQIESQRRLVEEFQNRLRKTEGERDHLQSTLSTRQLQQGQLETQTTGLKQEIESLKRRLLDAEMDRETALKRLETTKKLLEQQRYISSRQVSLSSETDEEKVHLQNKIDTLQDQLNSLRSENLNINSEDQKLAKSEKEALEQQVHFLNSVIVDMQHKNDDLKSRLEILETQVIFDGHLNLGVPSRSTSRLFCDICDSFDFHDTEDCPKQRSSYVRRQLSYSSQESEF